MDSRDGGSAEQGRSDIYTPEMRAGLDYVNRLRDENVRQRGLQPYMRHYELTNMEGQFRRAEAARAAVGETAQDITDAQRRGDREAFAGAVAVHHQAVEAWVNRGTRFHERAAEHLNALDAQREVDRGNAAGQQVAQQPAAQQVGAGPEENPLAEYQRALGEMAEANAAQLREMEADQPWGQSRRLSESFAAANAAIMSGALVNQQPASQRTLNFLAYVDHLQYPDTNGADWGPAVDGVSPTPGIPAPVPVVQPPMASGALAAAPILPAPTDVARAALRGRDFYGRQERNSQGRTGNAGTGSGDSYANAPHRRSSSPRPGRGSSPGR